MAEIFPVTPIGDIDISIDDHTTLLGTYRQNRRLFFDAPSFVSMTATVPADSLVDRNALLSFFHTHKGKLTPFWLRSYKKEFTLYDDALLGQNVIKVLTTQNYLLNVSNKPVVIYIDDLAFMATVSTSREVVDDNDVRYEELILSTNLPATLLKSGNTIIERLYYVRFMQDTLTFNFYDVGTSTVKLGFKELTHEYPAV